MKFLMAIVKCYVFGVNRLVLRVTHIYKVRFTTGTAHANVEEQDVALQPRHLFRGVCEPDSRS